MKSRSLGIAIAFAVAVSSLLLFGCSGQPAGTPATVPQPPSITVPANDEVAALKAEIERLKKVVPDQAHAMADVDYHFTNLWFAGTAKNWPLADFYWKESLSHIKWGVRIIPVRKDNAGKEVKLEEILQSIEQSPFLQMGEVIKKQDAEQFEPTYRHLLEGCYSCHKASDKPYLRPRIPDQPASRMMNFDPKGDWPK